MYARPGPLRAVVGAALSGIGGLIGYKLGYNPGDPAWTVWRQWVASDTIGIIAVAPLVIGFVAGLLRPPSRGELIEGLAALITVAAATGMIIFLLPPDWWEMCVAVVLLFPVVLFVAARCRPAWFASTHRRPMSGSSAAPRPTALLTMQR